MHNFYQTSRMTSLLFSLEKIKATRKKEREREREREILFDNPLYQQITAGIGEGHHMPAYRMYELTYAINYLNN